MLAVGDGADGQLRLGRCAELADDQHIQWGGQRRGDLGGHDHAAPGQTQHDDPGARVSLEASQTNRELAAGVLSGCEHATRSASRAR